MVTEAFVLRDDGDGGVCPSGLLVFGRSAPRFSRQLGKRESRAEFEAVIMPVARSVGIDLSYDEAYRSGIEYMLKRSYALLAVYYNMSSASACGKYPLCPSPLSCPVNQYRGDSTGSLFVLGAAKELLAC